MRRSVGAIVIALVLATPEPAEAWDPTAGGRAPVRPLPAPVAQPVPRPVPPPVPAGVYRVTDVYVANAVTRSGALTTYTTITQRQDPGTYARVLETVATGRASSFDGAAFNGRATLTDGRAIAGTYYENFILQGGAFVPVSVVFFQDDRELAAQRRAVPTPTPVIHVPVATPIPLGSWRPIPIAAVPPPAAPTPVQIAAPAAPPPAPTAAPTPSPTQRIPTIVPGLATSPLGAVAGSVTVLRGRAIDLWVRATVDGRPGTVSDWRIVSGEHVALGPVIGRGGEPFRARWDDVTGPGAAWTTQIEATVHVAGVAYTARGEVRIAVRAPALVR